MSAIQLLSKQLPVFLVHGKNWCATVRLDEYNAEFDESFQRAEAVTRAIEAFKGENQDVILQLDEGEDALELGPVVFVQSEGTRKEDFEIAFTHVALADAGYYKDSQVSAKLLLENVTALEQEHGKDTKFLEALAVFKKDMGFGKDETSSTPPKKDKND